jgi:hypothetical protein
MSERALTSNSQIKRDLLAAAAAAGRDLLRSELMAVLANFKKIRQGFVGNGRSVYQLWHQECTCTAS